LYTRRSFLWQTASAAVGIAAAPESAQSTEAALGKPSRLNPKGIVRLAIVGTGQISHRYFKQVNSQRARFVATCARTLSSAKARAAEYDIKEWFDDYEVMYDRVKPDAVIIATPSSVHAAPALAAFKRGIHVLCEKPMATSYEDCEAMVAAAQRSGAVFLALPYPGTPAFSTALHYLNEDTLGVLTGAEAQLNVSGHPRANWYYDKNAAGGVMLDTMVYPVADLIEILGPARRVTGFVNTLIPRRIVGDQIVESNIDDNVSLVLEWSGGQQALLRAFWGSTLSRNDAIIYGRHATMIISGGDEVVIHSPDRPIQGAEAITWRGEKNCYRLPVKPIPNITGEGLIDHFVDCILGLAVPKCGGAQQLHVHEILFKGYEANRTGRAQELTTTFRPWHAIDPSFLDTRSRPI
jgi:predicted dehydrogenase